MPTALMLVGSVPESSLVRNWGEAGQLSNPETFSLTGESVTTGFLPVSEKEAGGSWRGDGPAWRENGSRCRTGRDLPEGSS